MIRSIIIVIIIFSYGFNTRQLIHHGRVKVWIIPARKSHLRPNVLDNVPRVKFVKPRPPGLLQPLARCSLHRIVSFPRYSPGRNVTPKFQLLVDRPTPPNT